MSLTDELTTKQNDLLLLHPVVIFVSLFLLVNIYTAARLYMKYGMLANCCMIYDEERTIIMRRV